MSLTMNVTYADFPTLTPSKSDKVVGGVASNGDLYCRHCMYQLGMSWDGVKYITRSRAVKYIYNCCRCGWRIMPSRMYKNE